MYDQEVVGKPTTRWKADALRARRNSDVKFKAMADTFTWLNKQGVRSSAGFEVQTVDRFTLEYREGAKVVSVPIEPGYSAGRSCVLLGEGAFSRWDPPLSGLLIGPERQSQMLKNFTAAMEFQSVGVSAP